MSGFSGPNLSALVAADGASGGFLQDSQLDTDGALAANSASKVPAQSAVVTYVAAAIAAVRNGVDAAYDTLAELAAAITNLLATTISAAGLATGGGSLAANRTITVPAATDAEARAQTSTTAALTPSNLAGIASFSAHKNGTDQTSIADATYTQLTFGTELFDVGSLFASNAWTPPAGKVWLNLVATMTTAVVALASAFCVIYKNGSARWFGWPRYATVNGDAVSGVTVIDTANGSDVYTAYVYIDSAAGGGVVAGLTGQTWFAGAQA